MGSAATDIDRKPSAVLSLAIFVVSVGLMAYLRLHLYHDRFISLTYGLPLLICLWHEDRRLLWSMAGAFTVMAGIKSFFMLADPDPNDWAEFVQWLMQVANIAAIGASVHAIIILNRRQRGRNLELQMANEELAAREEEIGRQNDELQTQSEGLARQNEELQQQTEELNRHNEEVQQQAEELEQQTEELQTQAEELRTTNDELNHRESMLATILASLQGDLGDERQVMAQICRSLVPLLGGTAVAAAVVEQVGAELVVRTHTNLDDLALYRWPIEQSFARIVMERGQTAFIDDLAARPDLIVPKRKRQLFRSILAAPLLLHGKAIGAVEVYAEGPQRWTTEHFRIVEWVAAQCSIILEVIRAGAALRESEERLVFAMETSRTGVWELDLRDHTAHRSLEHDRIFGYAEVLPQWTYEMFLEHVLPEDRPMVDSKFRHAVATGGDWSFECRIRRADQEVRWVWAAGRHRADAAGVRWGMAGIVQDITERKHAEQLLRASEERHRLLAETMLQGVVHQNADGTIIAMNPAAERILGKTPEQFLGSSSVRETHHTTREDGSLFPGQEHPSMVALRTGQPVRGVVMGVFNPREEAYRWISIDAVPVCRPGESRPIEVYTVFEDITEHKRAEEALRASEARFRTLADAIPQLAWMAQADGFIHWYNQQWYRYTGTTPQQMEGWGWQGVHDPEVLPKVLQQWKTSIATGEPFEMVFPLRGADGQFRLFLTRVLPLRDRGRPRGAMVWDQHRRGGAEACRGSAARQRASIPRHRRIH